MSNDDAALKHLAERLLAAAAHRGASASECVIRQGRELSVTARLGQTESIKQAEGNALGLRVFRGQQAGVSYSSDLSWPALEQTLDAALALASSASADPFSGLPAPEQLGEVSGDLRLYSPAATAVTPEQALAWCVEAERAALDADPRLSNSDGATFEASEGLKVLANSHGFSGSIRHSVCSLAVVP
ncbi:MAG: PmbA/TldA family metallopeptidase, partial [Terriglobales bacterium]